MLTPAVLGLKKRIFSVHSDHYTSVNSDNKQVEDFIKRTEANFLHQRKTMDTGSHKCNIITR